MIKSTWGWLIATVGGGSVLLNYSVFLSAPQVLMWLTVNVKTHLIG